MTARTEVLASLARPMMPRIFWLALLPPSSPTGMLCSAMPVVPDCSSTITEEPEAFPLSRGWMNTRELPMRCSCSSGLGGAMLCVTNGPLLDVWFLRGTGVDLIQLEGLLRQSPLIIRLCLTPALPARPASTYCWTCGFPCL